MLTMEIWSNGSVETIKIMSILHGRHEWKFLLGQPKRKSCGSYIILFSWLCFFFILIWGDGWWRRLAYLHEAIEPKVVHRDIKSSNILIDDKFNSKISDFGLAKLLGADKSFITTRVMGTFG